MGDFCTFTGFRFKDAVRAKRSNNVFVDEKVRAWMALLT
jgi:hypothetical protein